MLDKFQVGMSKGKVMISELTQEFRLEIAEKGYETRSGRVKFSKGLRDRFRRVIGDYHSDEIEITAKLIEVYNEETRA